VIRWSAHGDMPATLYRGSDDAALVAEVLSS